MTIVHDSPAASIDGIELGALPVLRFRRRLQHPRAVIRREKGMALRLHAP